MAKNSYTSNEIIGTRVIGGKNGTRRIGKVRRLVFHPKEKRVIGFIVKRPDLLWMFRRKDKFVSIDGYDLIDGRLCIRNEPDATDRAACKKLGVDWDSCVLWIGLPILSEDGTEFGFVGTVTFNRLTGAVESIETDGGATSNTLLGKRVIPADLITGFRRGMGAAIAQTGRESEQTETTEYGAILVSDEAKDIVAEGGLAEKAGAATAVAADKAGMAVKKTGDAVNKGAKAVGERAEATKEGFVGFKDEFQKESGAAEKKKKALDGETVETESASEQIGKAVNQGAKAVGKQIKKSKGMFSAFKEEYDKARHDD
ncbi:PRC-barrel domain-containing protein [Raoultibacter phocaeensis]|uniref:PRC-barrel domain-containing protein n=1 Tax=Raoultibacter phocaeensis TaxID=2479841 RepID=UPI0011199644|nr:PRC-barrel domain-containing protein [Raoultibacter phocaeensis]